MKQSILYISYDGMFEPLGQSQVLAYLKLLVETRCIYLISYEKAEDWSDDKTRKRINYEISKAGIIWYPLLYHKSPLAFAKTWDIACGILLGLWLILRYKISIVHARSYLPSVIAVTLKKITGVKYLFDMRGFWADERVDGGLWAQNGIMFRVAKYFERIFLINSDHVVSLTHAAIRELSQFDYLSKRMPLITVIPTCTDLARFTPHLRGQEKQVFTLGYVGSVGTWYQFDAVVNCFVQLLHFKPNAQFLIINRSQHSYIRSELIKAGIPDFAYKLISANYDDVAAHIRNMDAGIFFYRPSLSRTACSPTKLGEFLACGVPCISNEGVGDMSAVLEEERVGVSVNSFNDDSLIVGLQKLLQLALDPNTQFRCVAAAQKHFSLDEGVSRYCKIYDQLDD
jgi:glycosyltransferase involved in cell wall biosynthesis